MKVVEQNDSVTLTFIGTLDNGDEFMAKDSTDPLTVTIGESELPPTIENALIGLKEGDNKKILVDPDEGYGPRQKDLLQTITNKEFRERVKPKPGMIVYMNTTREGHEVKVPATVISVDDDGVVIDYNHPLAGHNLTYQITILSIQKGTN